MSNLNIGTRLGSMVTDHMIMTFIIGTFMAPGIMADIAQTFNNPDAQPKLMLGNYYLNIFAFSLYFNKDIFLGRSFAKRIFKFQVVDARTNLPANSMRCFVRNITVIAWPIEVIVSLINNQRRVGDFIAGTKLVPYNPEEHKARPNWLFIILALAASILFTYFVMFYPIEVLTRGSGLEIG